MNLKNNELLQISGGSTATMINALTRAGTLLLDLGRTIGTSINMIRTGRRC